MLKKPLVVGVGQVPRWSNSDTVSGVLNILGENSGNMMFTESIMRSLYNSKRSSFAIPDESLEDRDCIVLAAANWINEFEDFSWLANRLEQIDLPVFLIGVGAQSDLDHEIPDVPIGTQRLLKISSDRSNLISARGEFTCDVLNKLGIYNVVPTGCPSMLLAGRAGPKFVKQANLDNVLLHSTRHGFNRANSFQTWLYREAMRNDWSILLQSEHADIYYALDKTGNPEIISKADPILKEVYGTDNIDIIAKFLRDRGVFFSGYENWISGMERYTFCIGSRIHGTVASIISGTPSVLIAHDSRTLELASAMHIPYILSKDIIEGKELPLEKMIEIYENSKSFSKYGIYFNNYLDFFEKNGLSHNII